MRAYVFTDAALTKHAGRFAWLSIDVDQSANAGFLEKFPINNLPTLLVIDPATEQIGLKWLGSVNVPQLEKLLSDGELAIRNAGGDPAALALARADRLNGQDQPAEAAKAFREALTLAPPGWERRPRTVESLAWALYQSRDYEECAKVARELAPTLPRGPSFANTAAAGLACTLSADASLPWRTAALNGLEPMVREAIGLSDLLADDRSGLYDLMVSLEDERKDKAAAKKWAGDWITFLEAEAAKAPTPEARAAFDPHRMVAALHLEDPARVIPALQASEKDLPDDYNAPARLAVVFRELGRLEEALAASDRALAKVYGPRKLRVYSDRAKIYEKMGDKAAAARTLEEAIAYGRALPESQRPDGVLQRMQSDLERLK